MNADEQPEVVTVEPAVTATVRGTVPMEELTSFYDSSFHTLGRVLAEQGVEMAEAPFGLYHGRPADTVDLEVGFCTDQIIESSGDAHPSRLPGGRVARLVHAGSYDSLGEAWGRLGEWIGQQGLTPGGALWEVYLTEPSPEMDPGDLRTELNWLLQDEPGDASTHPGDRAG